MPFYSLRSFQALLTKSIVSPVFSTTDKAAGRRAVAFFLLLVMEIAFFVYFDQSVQLCYPS